MKTMKLSHEVQGKELILRREFNAPREKVFEAFSECEYLQQWWGPRSWPVRYCTIEFHQGGVWHYCLQGPEHEDESWGKAVFKEIRKPEYIAFDDHFSDAEGNINHAMPTSFNEYRFAEENGKTILDCRSTYSSEEDVQKVMDLGAVDGIAETFDRLDELLEKISK